MKTFPAIGLVPRAVVWSVACLSAAILMACGGGGGVADASSTKNSQNVGRLDESSCPYTLHPSQDAARQVRCGLLVVPQDRRNPSGPVVRVPYAVFKSPQPSELTPVVYLTGGPGQTWKESVPEVAASQSPGFAGGAKLLRDEIVIEQRGSAATTPALDQCEGPTWFPSDHADWRDVLGAAVADVRTCATSVESAGIRAPGFNSDELATDVADLVRLLGYDKVVLNGVSYGTLWASAVLRDHPERVESAILDSVVQQSQPAIASQLLGFQAALQGADEACATEPTLCGPVGSGLLVRTEALVQDLEARTVAWSAGPGGRFTSGAAVSILTQLLAFYPLPEVPAFLDFVELLVQGDLALDVAPPSFTSALLELVSMARPGSGLAQYLSITCADNAAVKPAEMQAQLSKVRPALQPLAQAQLQEAADICAAWPARRDLPASSFAPVRSAVPVLILSGATDPLTPRAWAEEAARTLSGATLVSFPLRGHSLQSGSCVSGIVAAFLERRQPDLACAATDRGT
ncbi:MAG: alpha/beta hydrolase [Betaproteobacteria bacterium]